MSTKTKHARKDVFFAAPEEFTVIDDEKHALYDPRIKKPLKAGLVSSVRKRGIRKPILVRRDGGKLLVIDGRQRHRAAVAVNELFAKEEVPKSQWIKVPYMFASSDDNEAMSLMVELNELNMVDDLTTKSEKAQRLIDRGVAEEEVAESFGVTTTTIKSWLKLRECHPKVMEAVESQKIRMADAIKIGKMEREDQVAQIAKVAETNPTRATRKERGEKARKTVTPVTRLRKVVANKDALGIDARTLIDWIMGDATRSQLQERHPKLAESLS